MSARASNESLNRRKRQVSVALFLWFTQNAYKGTQITWPFQNKAESDLTASIGLIKYLSKTA